MKFLSIIVIALVTSITVSSNASTFIKVSTSDLLYTELTQPELHCLALNIYHEARADNVAGRYAVADVVLNRVKDDRWPSTICEVVYEGPVSKWWKEAKNKTVPIRNRCQFSWYCDGKSDEPKNVDAWRDAQEIAFRIYNMGVFRGISEGATHYHATYVDPSWNKRMQNIGRIGQHLFFRAP